MSHRDAPPLTPEQERMERWYHRNTAANSISFGRTADGTYLAEWTRLAWKAWQAAQQREKE